MPRVGKLKNECAHVKKVAPGTTVQATQKTNMGEPGLKRGPVLVKRVTKGQICKRHRQHGWDKKGKHKLGRGKAMNKFQPSKT